MNQKIKTNAIDNQVSDQVFLLSNDTPVKKSHAFVQGRFEEI